MVALYFLLPYHMQRTYIFLCATNVINRGILQNRLICYGQERTYVVSVVRSFPFILLQENISPYVLLATMTIIQPPHPDKPNGTTAKQQFAKHTYKSVLTAKSFLCLYHLKMLTIYFRNYFQIKQIYFKIQVKILQTRSINKIPTPFFCLVRFKPMRLIEIFSTSVLRSELLAVSKKQIQFSNLVTFLR